MNGESDNLKKWFGSILAWSLPFITCIIQWLLWPFISPFVWFLFFPAVFFSARVGRMVDGIAASLISAILVWFFFIPPQLSFRMEDISNSFSIGLFLVMGVLFSLTHDRLRKANLRAVAALNGARAVNEQLQDANGRINTLYQKTLELDKLKTQFFSNVSHELRTPLALILGPLQKTLGEGGLSDGVRANLTLIERNATLLHHHVSDLLDISKIEAGRMDVRYSQLDLARLLRAMASHFEGAARERAIRYTVSAPETLTAESDREKARRILLNLLSNAFKFVPDGGLVDLTLEARDGHAVITVRDNGPGVPADMRQAVFERFFQVEGYAARAHDGTGLGLSIVKEFTELLGGTILCGEAPEKGALFTLTLPLTAPPGVRAAPEFADPDGEQVLGRPDPAIPEGRTPVGPSPDKQLPPRNRPLVLVVEDNPDMNSYITAILDRHYRVASAYNGEEGLATAMKIRPDLIVADVMMPRMSGDQMAIELRASPDMADVPIIMLTAKADDQLRLKMLRQGIQEYLSKPFSEQELLARIGVLLADRRRSLEQLRASEAKFRALFEHMLSEDISERKRAEEKILQLNNELEQRVKERTAELVAANEELDAFAYAVSHDLRAPLRAMSGFSQALLEDYGEKLDGEAGIFLNQIITGGRRMGYLIDGLLALSRCTRGDLRRERVDLSEIAERILHGLAKEEPARRVIFEVTADLFAEGDAAMLEVVMDNLLTNAWKFTARRPEAEIRVVAREGDEQRLICVVDNGAGFDAAHAAKLFQPFQRLHRQEEFPGIGIGLATVQRIIHRHGGTISGEGKRDRGATFCFNLPCPNKLPSMK
jgi:signal transduction histidine kinase